MSFVNLFLHSALRSICNYDRKTIFDRWLIKTMDIHDFTFSQEIKNKIGFDGIFKCIVFDGYSLSFINLILIMHWDNAKHEFIIFKIF